ncbi:MAG: hypothetical protein VCC99_00435 [Alphaproteobacteria bacterium]
MKALLIAGLVSIAIFLTAGTAQAGRNHHHGGFNHGHHNFHHGGHHRGHFRGHHRGHHYAHRGHYNYGDEILIGVGILAGVAVLNRLLTPVYTPPPPVYYAPPPRTCFQNRVYRYLPNGRIQWGTRTTCH